jgi:carbonic anhydrase
MEKKIISESSSEDDGNKEFSRKKTVRDDEWEKIFNNNKVWAAEKLSKDANYFIRLSSLQKPDFLWIGCADSRVPANEIIGLQPGEVFVHRNIANLVIATDINAQSVIEYAVRHLKVKHIIVCGHYGCGGVKCAMDGQNVGFLNPWITHIKDVYSRNREEVDKLPDYNARFNRLVELNVIDSCLTLMKNFTIQESYHNDNLPIIHACVYDLTNGILNDLDICFMTKMDEFRKVYWMV